MGSMVDDRVALKLDEKLNELYRKIGKSYYEKNSEAEIADEELKELVENVKQVFVDRKNLEIANLAKKGLKKCPSCENTVTIESRFCNMCGEKFDESSIEELKKMAAPVQKKCVSCGEVLEKDAIFCHNCGTRN